jgi:large subunit ribosomal protein L17
VRHRIAGNRINMPEARRRAAFRSMIDGLYTHEHIQTTEARAKAIQGEAERLITIAIRGHNKAWEHLSAVVPDRDTAEQVLALARRARFAIDEVVPSNEQRAARKVLPLSDDARKLKEARLSAFQKEMLGIIKNRDDAQKALTAAREAMALELHARRTILRHLPHELRVKKIFEQFVPRYAGRPGGYTRISKIGFRQGDGAHIVRLEMV